jgi:tetratricopeptide (TPR) repeat protein
VITYNTLMNNADFQGGKELLAEMREKGIAPDVITYSTLMDKADFRGGKELLAEMREKGIAPNVITYSMLMGKADFRGGKELLAEMREKGIAPDVITYVNLFKAEIGESAEELLKWYLAQPNHPDTPIGSVITSYRRLERTRDALRLALDYAHLPAARKLIRDKPQDCLAYFNSFLSLDSYHPNADYALGVAYLEQTRLKEARRHLEKALKLATAESRKAVIRDWLRQIQASK